RLVPTPKLPKRIPSVLSAEEINGFLNHLATMKADAAASGGALRPGKRLAKRDRNRRTDSPASEGLLLRRDRALLELLYAAGLRVSELTGLNLEDIEQKERVLRVRGKGRKERIVPYGSKAQEALEKYWPVRAKLLEDAELRSAPSGAAFLNYAGRRLTQRSVARIVKK